MYLLLLMHIHSNLFFLGQVYLNKDMIELYMHHNHSIFMYTV